ncbi:DUF1566 domain-containing protein [Desulfovibrio mangrovi]|uniref:Lcl domain-containing protein n=1 Tax=Desulfovibrio mangrovi TaxID=2976983 RepID=UPI0022451614|nr:DUF1566 domain-containing protein [Desulfovibrio mangrovi]UZP65818.1 DUF1566 domain-containing protein [Desulfovibrio mangrovi]
MVFLMMRRNCLWKALWLAACLVQACVLAAMAGTSVSYPVVETGQQICYDDKRVIPCPAAGRLYRGQDAQYAGHAAAYRDNKDGTVSDLVTGLMWVKARGDKMYWNDAMNGARDCRTGGHSDWRAPTIKELYSLIDFRGRAMPSGTASIPFVDTRYFDFAYGNVSTGERTIDCQDWSATEYTGTVMGGEEAVFGVNFADGRIKGYPKGRGENNPRNKRYIRYVRGNPDYGKNDFKADGASTVTDRATGLMWQRRDSGEEYDWPHALAYCENLSLAGYDDWRLPDAKELQSIVDYSRSPESWGGPALSPLLETTVTESYFWTSTTHLDGPHAMSGAGTDAVYVAFGRAVGYFRNRNMPGKSWMDVHGAGAQRSDPKTGSPKQYPTGFGPQGDDRRIYNFVRCVRGGAAVSVQGGGKDADKMDLPPWSGMWKGRDAAASPDAYSGGSGGALRPEGRSNGARRMPEQGGTVGDEGSVRQHSFGRTSPPSEIHPGSPYAPGHGGALQGGHPAPPRRAVTACSGHSEHDVCSLSTPHGMVEGLCRWLQGELACVPEGEPEGGSSGRMQ